MRKKIPVYLGYIILLLLSIAILLSVYLTDGHSTVPASAEVFFQGECQTANGRSYSVIPGSHIPATRGTVVLKGALRMTLPDGKVITPAEDSLSVAMYLNHLDLEIRSNGQAIFPLENYTGERTVCGKQWVSCQFPKGTAEDLEIILKNPHRFGNNAAVDEFLDSLYIDTGMQFQTKQLKEGAPMWIAGLCAVIVSFVIIGIAVFSSVMGLNSMDSIWQVGIAALSGGSALMLTSNNIILWGNHIALHTAGLLLCSMLYMVFLQFLVLKLLPAKKAKLEDLCVVFSCLLTTVILAIGLITNLRLYDLMGLWVLGQCAVNLILLRLCIRTFFTAKKAQKVLCLLFCLAIIAFFADAAATLAGIWAGCFLSRYMFIGLFIYALLTSLHMLPHSFRMALKAHEIETELERSRTAIMLSQIQPHFLINSLGAIRALCIQNPEEARHALNIFITYLRCNMDSLKSERPIPFTKELLHIEAYLQLEQLRFGDDLKVFYDIEERDFFLPSLSIQPLVENAVKHGICGKEEGGTVTLTSRKEGDRIIIQITDNGIGFDPNAYLDQTHIGIQNVRNRLHHMSGGTLDITSTPGQGTVATVQIKIQ